MVCSDCKKKYERTPYMRKKQTRCITCANVHHYKIVTKLNAKRKKNIPENFDVSWVRMARFVDRQARP